MQGTSLWETLATHPLGIVGGAIGGALLGFVAGLAAGPVGSLLGAVGGAIAGVVLGKSLSVGPQIDLSPHDRYWREHYASRPYVAPGADYGDYGPAYRYGSAAYLRSDQPSDWPAVQAELARGWQAARDGSRLPWEQAQPAVRDAWDRLQRAPQ
jgi:hypothetical protein